MAGEDAVLERSDDLGTDGPAIVRRWLLELALADKRESKWRERARKIVTRYRDDQRDRANGNSRWNVLWANTETLAPVLYDRQPEPDVRRRWPDENPLGREVATVLERAVDYTLDTQDFDGVMEGAIQDYLLTGRGTVRVRYTPTFAPGEPPPIPLVQLDPNDPQSPYVDRQGVRRDVAGRSEFGAYALGTPTEELVFEDVELEQVEWSDLRLGQGGTWQKVPWIGFHHEMTREELVDAFGAQKGNRVTLDGAPAHMGRMDDMTEGDQEAAQSMRTAEVWEFWEKRTRKVYYICKGFPDGPLDEFDDPLKLSGFYPIPEPIYSVRTTGNLVPIPEFTLYQDQADELDRVTERIDKLIDSLRVRGAVDGSLKETMTQLMDAQDGKLVPVDSWNRLLEKAGGRLEGAVAWFPIEQNAKVLLQLYQQREQLLQTIYQLTGISDIFRGATDPRETRGAQQLKARFGGLRLSKRQRRIERFARDLVRMCGEVVAELFHPRTLMLMTGQQVGPEMVQMMRSDWMRTYTVDIETDSTVALDDEMEKKAAIEFLNALAATVEKVGPLVAAGQMPMESARAIIMFAARRFKASRELEEALESIGSGQAMQQQQQEQRAEQMGAELEKLKLQVQAMAEQRKSALEAAKAQSNEQIAHRKLDLEEEALEVEKRKIQGDELIRTAQVVSR